MADLSEIQIGYIRRSLNQVLNLVPGPAPSGAVEVVRPWCQQVCGVDTLAEVGKRWAQGVRDLGGTLLAVGLAETVRQNRPPTPHQLVMVDLDTVTELAQAVLCLAVDEAEAEDIFRGARLAAQAGRPFPEPERERAAQLAVDVWQIADVLRNTLLVDQETFGRFQDALRSCVESLLPKPAPPLDAGALAAMENHDGSAPQAVMAQAPAPQHTPNQYLMSWREILDALEMKNNPENQRRVREANQRFEGPIALPKKGGQPRVNKATLLTWWNRLEIKFMTQGEGNNTQATVEAQHAYGREGTVVPDISGHVLKRHGKKADG
jgi:hypothetical protein